MSSKFHILFWGEKKEKNIYILYKGSRVFIKEKGNKFYIHIYILGSS